MGTTGPPPEGGDDAGGSQRPPEVNKWIDGIRDFAAKAARKRRHPEPSNSWKPRQKDEAAALNVSEPTYSRWCRGTIPREKTLQGALTYADADPTERINLLGLRQSAAGADDPARPATHEAAPMPDLTSTAPAAMDEPCPAGSESAAAATPTRQDIINSILRDARDEGHLGSTHERGSEMTASVTEARDAGHLPPSDSTDTARATTPSPPPHLVQAGDALARHLFDQWDQIAAARRLDIPPPLPVRWHRSQLPVAGPVEVAVSPHRRTRFAPLSGTPAATADAVQSGDLDDLFAIYGGLGSGRIVLLGRYGSGKTGTAILMVLNALDHRLALTAAQSAYTPVPVLLTAHGWDPRSTTLADWFADQLASSHDFLRAAQYGPDAAGELVRNGMVTLFLDGFDELEPKLRKVALQRIGRERRTFRLVVLARTEEFADAAQSGPLPGAVALELEPFSPDDAAQYLQWHQRDPISDDDPFQPLIDHLRHQPESPVAQALDSPLTLTLVRDDPQAITQLLEQGRFDIRAEVEDFLLERVVPLAYGPDQPPGPSPQQAQQWLGFLATQMRAHRGDLAWWQMHHWAPARWRVLANAVAGIVAMSCIGAVLFGPLGRYTMDGHTGTLFGIIYGAGIGAIFGLLAGLVSEVRHPHPNRHGRVWSSVQQWSTRFNPAIGLLIGVAVTIAIGNQSSYLFGWPTGIVAGYFAGRAAADIRLVSPNAQSRWDMLRPSTADVLAALLAGLPIGLAYGLTKTPQHGILAALVTTFAFGLMISMSRPLSGPDISTDPATAWRRDRRRGLVIGLAAGVPIAVVLGIQNGQAHGLLAGITAVIAHVLIISAACTAGACDSWRITLLFGQLRKSFPLQGMQFLHDARARGVLRTAGPYIQFKHARLQDILANHHQRHPQGSTDHANPSAN